METNELPRYTIYNSEWFRDKRVGEYRHCRYPMLFIPMDIGDQLVNNPSYENIAVEKMVKKALIDFGSQAW